MKPKRCPPVIVSCVCLLGMLLGMGLSGCSNPGQPNTPEPSAEPGLLAEYHGEKVYQADVERYQQNVDAISSGGTADLPTTEEALNEILRSMVLLEEAQRLGYEATQAEIDALVENAELSYAIPEGKEMIDQYCQKVGITAEEYFALLEEQAPRNIARQKLLNAVGEAYCEEHGLTYTRVNPPAEMLEAREAYVADLFAKAQDEITYYNMD